MEPLSIVTSLIALVGAVKATLKIIDEIRRRGRPPPYLLDASNRITDLQTHLDVIEETIKKHGRLLSDLARDNTEKHLDDAAHHILDFKRLLQSLSPKPDSTSSRITTPCRNLRRLNEQEVLKFQLKLQRIKDDLAAALHSATFQISLSQTAFIVQSISYVHAGQSMVPIRSAETPQEASNLIMDVATVASEDPKVRDAPNTMGPKSYSYVVIETKSRMTKCPRGCPCRCHIPFQASTPRWLQGLLGNFFISFTGTPGFNCRPCNFDRCGASEDVSGSLRFRYIFPAWILPYGLDISGAWSSLRGAGALWTLRIPRWVDPSTSFEIDDFNACRDDDGMKQFMRQHNIHPMDLIPDVQGITITENVLTTVRYHLNTFCALVEEGGDPYIPVTDPPSLGKCNLGQIFWFRYLLHFIQQPTHIHIPECLQLENFIDSLGFSALHKVVIGLIRGDLRTLAEDPSSVHAVDCFGMTPLHWAVGHLNIDAVKLLLEVGASTNVFSRIGETPLLLLAAMAHNQPSVAESILEALLSRGANIHDRSIPCRHTCLVAACEYDDLTFCQRLVEAGADIHAKSLDGRTAVHSAIRYNCPTVLEYLIKQGALLPGPSHKLPVLVVQCAGIKMIRLLRNMEIGSTLSVSTQDINRYWRIFETQRWVYPRGEDRYESEIAREEFGKLLDRLSGTSQGRIAECSDDSDAESDSESSTAASTSDEQDESSGDDEDEWEEGKDAEFHDALDSIPSDGDN